MYLARIEFTNWLRYRGHHAVDLAPIVYGIGAELDGDRERSNWVGKTSFAEGIAFGVTGWHRWAREDDWITRGESEGGVRLIFNTGLDVERTRRRGKPTQLVVRVDGATAHGEQAQRLLNERVGLSESDFFATCFFRQKQMSRFITATPSARMEIVGEWFQLGKLEAAEEAVRERFALAAQRLEDASQQREMKRSLLRALGERHEIAELDEASAASWFEAQLVERKSRVRRIKQQLSLLEEEQNAARAWQGLVDGAANYQRLMGESETARVQLASLPRPDVATLRRDYNEAEQARRLAEGQGTAKRSLAAGTFDGHCPVGEMLCPVADTLNAQRTRNLELARAAEARVATARAAVTRAKNALEQGEAEALAIQRLEARIQTFEEQARRWANAARQVANGTPPLVTGDAEQVRGQLVDAEIQLRQLETSAADHAQHRQQIEKLAVQILAAQEEVTAHREAVAVLKTARRQIAEEALREINRGANRLLQSAGIPLVVAAKWDRETATLAKSCDLCGAVFPSSQRVKACERCGAARGPKMEQRLDVELSDRSGAAEDLAGVAIQLSAGAWLRSKRSASWSIACIDEPFGALDASNRQALAAHLLTMLRTEYGFQQAFVIAHEGGLVDVMPGRVRVIGRGSYSTLEVEGPAAAGAAVPGGPPPDPPRGDPAAPRGRPGRRSRGSR